MQLTPEATLKAVLEDKEKLTSILTYQYDSSIKDITFLNDLELQYDTGIALQS